MIESDISIVKGPLEDLEQRFLDFRIGFKKTGAGVRFYAKWPAMEEFVVAQMEKDYGPGMIGGLTLSKNIKGAMMYVWTGRGSINQDWSGPPICYREKDPLWSGDGTYFNLWWCFIQGLKDGIHWDMRFPPDFTYMKGYTKHLDSFARDFGERTARPYDITLTVNMKVVR